MCIMCNTCAPRNLVTLLPTPACPPALTHPLAQTLSSISGSIAMAQASTFTAKLESVAEAPEQLVQVM